MNKNFDRAQYWSTSSFAGSADTSPLELAALGEHLIRCDGQRESLFTLKCIGDALKDFLAPRLMTILVLFAMLSAVASRIS
jgi:hypothetical protein